MTNNAPSKKKDILILDEDQEPDTDADSDVEMLDNGPAPSEDKAKTNPQRPKKTKPTKTRKQMKDEQRVARQLANERQRLDHKRALQPFLALIQYEDRASHLKQQQRLTTYKAQVDWIFETMSNLVGNTTVDQKDTTRERTTERKKQRP